MAPMIKRRDFLRMGRGGVGAIGFWLLGCRIGGDRIPPSSPVPLLQLDSPAFEAGGMIPARHTCDGEDLSPALRWSPPPDNTQSLVLIAEDLDAPEQPFTHWVLYDLSADISQLPEGLPTQPLLLEGGVQGRNDFDQYGYSGPCPPSGTHRYTFQIYALDSWLDLAPGATQAEVVAAMQNHILAVGELSGLYTR